MNPEPSPFFYGSYENRLNTKGQIAVPKRIRDLLPEGRAKEGLVLVPGQDRCIYLYTHEQFGEIRRRVRTIAEESEDAEFFRQFMEEAHAVDLDSQGRILLPAALRQGAGIEGPEVLFIGMDDRVEIWSPQARASRRATDEAYQERRRDQATRIFGL